MNNYDLKAKGFSQKELNKDDVKVCVKCHSETTCHKCMNFGTCMYAYIKKKQCLCNKCWKVHFGIKARYAQMNDMNKMAEEEENYADAKYEFDFMDDYRRDGILVLSFGSCSWEWLELEVES